jgi:hypothetical protein
MEGLSFKCFRCIPSSLVYSLSHMESVFLQLSHWAVFVNLFSLSFTLGCLPLSLVSFHSHIELYSFSSRLFSPTLGCLTTSHFLFPLVLWSVFLLSLFLPTHYGGFLCISFLFTHTCGFLPSVLESFPPYWAVSNISCRFPKAMRLSYFFSCFSPRSSLVSLLSFLFTHTWAFLPSVLVSFPSHWAVYLHLLSLWRAVFFTLLFFFPRYLASFPPHIGLSFLSYRLFSHTCLPTSLCLFP